MRRFAESTAKGVSLNALPMTPTLAGKLSGREIYESFTNSRISSRAFTYLTGAFGY